MHLWLPKKIKHKNDNQDDTKWAVNSQLLMRCLNEYIDCADRTWFDKLFQQLVRHFTFATSCKYI